MQRLALRLTIKETAIRIPFAERITLIAPLLLFFLHAVSASADPIKVRHLEGTSRGYLSARNSDGAIVAMGDFYEIVHGDRVTLHLIFHFKDGSLDEDTTVFTQRGVFRVLTDHHIQRGPFFPHPLETTLDTHSGQVTVRTTGKDGKEEVSTEHMDLPTDLANGLSFVTAKNMPPNGSATVTQLIATPKPRLVKLIYTPVGEDTFTVAGFSRKATRVDMKVDLGGLAGVVAPLIGKQPPDFNVWIAGGDAPVLVKEVGYLYPDGPTLTFELASPAWPQNPDSKVAGSK